MKKSDICLCIRSIHSQEEGGIGSFEYALELIDKLKPTRIEWSYISEDAKVKEFKKRVPVFVYTLNTISPRGHAVNYEGEPIIAPWMKKFGKPDSRPYYMCQNNPEDVQARIDQVLEIIKKDFTCSFQHDDWYCNAQMLTFGNPCFCEHCLREFSSYLGIDINYKKYLLNRGISYTAELLELAQKGEVPLWDDYKRFSQQTVIRYFRKLRVAMDRFNGEQVYLSVNGSVTDPRAIEMVLPFVNYFCGETWNFSPIDLKKIAENSRKLEKMQIISFFPDVAVEGYNSSEFVQRINQAIGVCYCLGLLPLFPYNVYAGDNPRWYGTYEQYKEPYRKVYNHPEWFDDYKWVSFRECKAKVIIEAQHISYKNKRLEHTLFSDGKWVTKEL